MMFTTYLVAYFQPRFWLYVADNQTAKHTPLLMD